MRAHDWSRFPLGSPERWPAALRVAVGLVLASPESMYLCWGPDLLFFFNDAYRPILGPRLAQAHGTTLPRLWPDAFEAVRPMVERTFAGEACRFVDLPITMARRGEAEETWWTFSYSPVRDETGAIAGLFCSTNETTAQVCSAAALAVREARSQQILDSAVDFAIVATDRNGHVTDWNTGAERLLGWQADEAHGRSAEMFFTPEDRAAANPETEMTTSLANGRASDERWHVRRDGSRFWGSGEMMPLRGEKGSHLGFLKIMRDRTDQALARHRLENERARMAQMFAQAPGFMAMLAGPEHVFELVNPAYMRLIGHRDVIGRSVRDVLPDAVEQGYAALLDQVYQSGAALNSANAKYAVQAEPGGPIDERYIDFVFQPITDAAGHVTGIFVEGSDVTDRRNAETQRADLVNEMAHRLKNTLAMVQSIVAQTFRTAKTIEEGREAISGRLTALARAQDILTQASWNAASIRDVVNGALGPHRDVDARFEIDGPDAELTAQQGLGLALAIHELATNAAKYGSLRVAEGRVRIGWTASPAGAFRFEWTEAGGPPLQPPARTGFGSRLLERVVPAYFSGAARLSYDAGGLAYVVDGRISG